jgi:UDP-glucose 4-epimerase
MEKFNVTRLVFSSSSTVYGEKNVAPFHEGMNTTSNNPYGGTKLAIEKLLLDMTHDPATKWEVSMLRYFNPIGAHERCGVVVLSLQVSHAIASISGEIGDDPTGIPNNLVPFIEQVAVGRRECLTVFGSATRTLSQLC